MDVYQAAPSTDRPVADPIVGSAVEPNTPAQHPGQTCNESDAGEPSGAQLQINMLKDGLGLLLVSTVCSSAVSAAEERARSMRYTSRSKDQAIAWQKEVRAKFLRILKLDDLVSMKARIPTDMAGQVELLEAMLSCPYELPAAARIRAPRPQLPMLRHYSSQL